MNNKYIIVFAIADKSCDKKTDIIFVVDRSGSIRYPDYNRMRAFIEDIGKKLRIGVKNNKGEVFGQGAIVSFSDRGQTQITLRESNTPGKFARVVKHMSGPLAGGRTKIHRGLAVAENEVAIKESGLRVDDPDVYKVLVVITNGEQTRESVGFVYLEDAVLPFFARGIDVLAVGVGLNTPKSNAQLQDMVQVPGNVIKIDNYNDLSASVGMIVGKICPGTFLYIFNKCLNGQ